MGVCRPFLWQFPPCFRLQNPTHWHCGVSLYACDGRVLTLRHVRTNVTAAMVLYPIGGLYLTPGMIVKGKELKLQGFYFQRP